MSDNGLSAIKCYVKDIKSFEYKEQVIELRNLLEQYGFHIDMSTLEVMDVSLMALANLQDIYLYDEQRFMLVTDLNELRVEIEPELQAVCEHMGQIEEILEQQGVKLDENGAIIASNQEQGMLAVDGGNGRIVEFIPMESDGREYQ